MTWFLIAVLLPIIASAFLLARLNGGRRGLLTHLPTAAGLGLGTSSVVWWGIMLLPLASWRFVIAVDVTLWTLACGVIWRVAPWPAAPNEDGKRSWLDRWPPRVLLIVPLAGAAVYFVAVTATTPHGIWDAWAIWNARARFLFRGYPDVWTQAFSPVLDWSHPDYPLLVPVSVARAWTYVGRDHLAVPILLAATFTAGIVSTAAMSVARSASAWRGVLTAVMIVASPAFLANAVSQCADIPLAFYVLTTCVLVGRATETGGRPGWWAVAGIAAGLAAWTKNEGLAFTAIVLVICPAWSYRSRRWRGLAGIAPLFAGAAPILAALVVFKLLLAPPNDLIAAQSMGHVLSSLQNVDRVQIAVTAVGKELWFGGASQIGVLPILALFVIATGLRRPLPIGPMLGLAITGALIVADILAYILSPHDLAWQLRTSLDRVIVQVFPALVWCGMSLARVRAGEPRLASNTPGF